MKKIYYLLFTSILLFAFTSRLLAHSKSDSHKIHTSSVDLGAYLVSRYIWRGSQLGNNSPSIQPAFTFKKGSFEAGVYGAFSVSNNNFSQEIDLHVSQSFVNNAFTLTLTDYFFPTEFGNYHYFRYGKDETGHVFEGSLSFNGTKRIPFTFLLATNFYGADAARINNNPQSNDFNKKTGIQYSTYIEVGYSFELNAVTMNSFIGINATTPRKANRYTNYNGEAGFYGNAFGIVNLGFTASKSIPITKLFALPLSVSLITNLQTGKIYFVFGISF